MRAPLFVLLAALLLGPCPRASAQEERTVVSADTQAEPAQATPPADTAAPAAAATEPATSEPRPANVRRVAVLLLAAPGVDESVADDLTEVAIGAVAARGGVTIVGKEEIQARLGQGEARSLDCVTSAACVGRVGVQLDVDEVVSGTLNHHGTQWTFDLVRIDVRSGELLGRAYRELDGDLGVLAAAVQVAIPDLYVEHRPTASLRVLAGSSGGRVLLDGLDRGELTNGTLRLDGLEPGPHALVVELDSSHRLTRDISLEGGATLQMELSQPVVLPPPPGVRISSLVWVGSGLALVGGGVALGFGLASRRHPADGSTRIAASAYLDDRERDARIANAGLVGLGVGAGMAALGFLLSDFGTRSSSMRAELAPRGHFMVFLEGSL